MEKKRLKELYVSATIASYILRNNKPQKKDITFYRTYSYFSQFYFQNLIMENVRHRLDRIKYTQKEEPEKKLFELKLKRVSRPDPFLRKSDTLKGLIVTIIVQSNLCDCSSDKSTVL